MRHYANLLKNNQGFTIIEVLAAFVISTLVLAIAYGLLLAGMKTYEKIGIEQSMRDEADYVVSRIMQTFYEGEISDIKKDCLTTSSTMPESDKNICIEIHKTVASKIATGDNKKVGITSFNELRNSLIVSQIKIVKETTDGVDVNNVVIEEYEAVREDNKIKITNPLAPPERINSDKYDFVIAPKGSTDEGTEINAICSYESSIITDTDETDPTKLTKLINKKCSNGIVDISLMIKRANVENDKYKLQLKSQFGF